MALAMWKGMKVLAKAVPSSSSIESASSALREGCPAMKEKKKRA